MWIIAQGILASFTQLVTRSYGATLYKRDRDVEVLFCKLSTDRDINVFMASANISFVCHDHVKGYLSTHH